MGKEKDKGEALLCPVGKFFLDIEGSFGRKSQFFSHIDKSRIEFLKAIRSLVDEKIESLEKKGPSGDKRKSTRIKVE